MIRARSLALDVRYNNAPFAGQVGGEIENLTYIDSAADNSDSIDITLDAQDGKWLRGWLPEKGATLRPRIRGYNWEAQGDRRIIECGLFVLDDVSFSDAPTTLQIDRSGLRPFAFPSFVIIAPHRSKITRNAPPARLSV